VGSKSKFKSRPSDSNASSFRDWYPQTVPRPSPVRDAIRQCLTAQPRHGWSLDELLGQLHGVDVSADFSTVFRALNWLEGEGEVRRVDLGDGKARYEANTGHHEHVRCSSCGTVSEVPGCLVQGSTQLVEATTGFSITDHRLVFSGLCPTCKPG
jgi:Fur family transcriptional regulator, peroxide stress response regulator